MYLFSTINLTDIDMELSFFNGRYNAQASLNDLWIFGDFEETHFAICNVT